jgi:hypothetical protein
MVVDCAVALAAALAAEQLTTEAAYLAGFGAVAASIWSRHWHRLSLLFLCVLAAIAQTHVTDSLILRSGVFVALYLVMSAIAIQERTMAAVAGGLAVIAYVAGATRLLHNEFYRDCVLVAAVAAVPVPTLDLGWVPRRAVRACGLAFAFVGAVLVLCASGRASKIAMLEHGVWARTDHTLEHAAVVDQQALYSYAGLKRLLKAESITDTKGLRGVGELWVITPTEPFSASEVSDIGSWVLRGGRLIVVTDHTDFLGHARCANQLLEQAGMQVSDTALFPEPENAQVRVPFGQGISLLTSNAVSGVGVFPVIVARYIEEKPDYSGRNFFGPLSHSLDDRMRSRCVVGEKPYGAGSVCVVTDSTMFANFAVYLPDSQDLLRVVRTEHVGRVVVFLMPAVLAVLVLAMKAKMRGLSLAVSLGCLAAILSQFAAPSLHWEAPVPWSGDRAMLSNKADPDRSLSTAYAMFPVSGKQPQWTDAARPDETGVWVGRQPPPSPGWKWLSPNVNDGQVADDHGAILEAINPRPPVFAATALAASKVAYGRLWSNSAFGDWWVDAGISNAKRIRLNGFVSWCLGEAQGEAFEASSKDPLVECDLIVAAQVRASGRVRDVFARSGEVYLGRGVSGRIETVDGEKVIVGTPSLVEGWGVPSSWVIRRKPDKQ